MCWYLTKAPVRRSLVRATACFCWTKQRAGLFITVNTSAPLQSQHAARGGGVTPQFLTVRGGSLLRIIISSAESRGILHIDVDSEYRKNVSWPRALVACKSQTRHEVISCRHVSSVMYTTPSYSKRHLFRPFRPGFPGVFLPCFNAACSSERLTLRSARLSRPCGCEMMLTTSVSVSEISPSVSVSSSE